MKTRICWKIFVALAVLAKSATSGADLIADHERITYVRNGEARLRVFVEGSGPAIVLLPPQGRGPRDFDLVVKPLVSAGYCVVRPEPRGFGESVGPAEGINLRENAQDVVAVIEAMEIAPTIIVGWGYGNRIARMTATEWPALVRGVVLLAAGGKYPPKAEFLALQRKVEDRALPIEERADAARRVHYGPKSSISVVDMHLDGTSATTVRTQPLSPSVSLEPWWAGGHAPMLILQGLHDVLAPPENGRSLKRDFPQRVTLVEFEDLGHMMIRERPDAIAEAIVGWEKQLR